MVESIGSRLAAGASLGVRRTATDASTPTRSATATAAAPVTQTASGLARLTAEMAASPPVDTDRVAQIRQAIKDGSFPILPARIADSLIALRLDWKSNNEPA